MARTVQENITPSEIRDELLSQHASLRGRLEAVRVAVARGANGEVSQAQVRGELVGLFEALRTHNTLEERSLRDLVRVVDAWGQARVDIMVEAHVREHRDLCDAALAVGMAENATDGVKAFDRFCTHLLEHMAREEEAFLNASVLRDDEVAIDAQEG
jgi:hypothetical protein